MKNNQKGFGAVGILAVAAVMGLIGFVGWHTLSSSNNKQASSSKVSEQKPISQTKLTSQAQASNELQQHQQQSSVALLEPVSAESFGDFGATAANSTPQNSSTPTKLGSKVDTELYQGIVFLDSGKNRVLAGKLKDKSPGVLEISDAFELVSNGTQIILQVAKPNVLDIDTTKVIKWANLPNNNQMIRAVILYKKSHL